MTYEEVEKILTESRKEDWLQFSGYGTYVYKLDLNLRIQRKFSSNHGSYPFCDTPLDEVFGKGNIFWNEYIGYYNNSLLIISTLLQITKNKNRDFIAIIPRPETETTCLKIDANMARIIDEYDETDKYIEKAGLVIVEN